MPRSLRIDSSLNHLDLTGKRYVITGGSSGAGQATVEFLASHGAEVITSGRDVDRGRKNFESLPSDVRNRITLLHLDLQDMNSVEAFANTVNTTWPSFDGLVNNAGGALTKDGSFGHNGKTYDKLGLSAITSVCSPDEFASPGLENQEGARLINLSSVMHDQAKGMQSSQTKIH